MKHLARTVLVLIAGAVLMAALLASTSPMGAAPASKPEAPRFEVDPMWPKPLPHHWILGMTVGVSVDAQDHIWIVHRPDSLEYWETYAEQQPAIGDCCAPAPPVLEFDQEGNLINSWGGPGEGYEWPCVHARYFHRPGRQRLDWRQRARAQVAPGGSVCPGRPRPQAPQPPNPGAPYHDCMILKFTPQGKFLMQIGKAGQSKGSNDLENLQGPAKMWFDQAAQEIYVADGYGNRRVIVFDYETGKYKRHWGAYGHTPNDEGFGTYTTPIEGDQQFRNPVHCAVLSNDRQLYVCDRINNRIQIFNPQGVFQKEFYYYTRTRGDGSVWDIAFSHDPEQRFIYVADGANEKIHILDRKTMQVLTSFGDGGRQPGEFYAVHSIATDSKGNIFTTETYRGQRVQKFVFKGLAPVTTLDQGVVWPRTSKSR